MLGLPVVQRRAWKRAAQKLFSTESRGGEFLQHRTEASRKIKEKMLPIGIVGCGLGGSSLARFLHLHDIPYMLFERDSSFTSRAQGYALTIQQGIQSFPDLKLSIDSEKGVVFLTEDKMTCTSFCTSHSHVSFAADGRVLGVYGAYDKQSTKPSACSESSASLETPSFSLGINFAKEKRKQLNSCAAESKKAKQNFHIPRQELRRVLLSGSDPKSVHWGHSLANFEECSAGAEPGLLLRFSNGATHLVSGLVAADGIYSTVRYLKNKMYQNKLSYPTASFANNSSSVRDSDFERSPCKSRHHLLQELRYLKLFVILGIARDVKYKSSFPNNSVSHDTNGYKRRKVQWVNGSTRVFSMPFDRENVMWQMSFPFSDSELDKHYSERSSMSTGSFQSLLKRMALKHCRGWHTPLTRMIESSDEALISGHPVYDRDIEDFSSIRGKCESHNERNAINEEDIVDSDNLDWELYREQNKVTMLGDAFHPMSPFKGQGANQALLDAQALGKAIVNRQMFLSREYNRRQSECEFSWSLLFQEAPMWKVFAEYERSVIPRAGKKVMKSRIAADVLHQSAVLMPGNVTRASVAEKKGI